MDLGTIHGISFACQTYSWQMSGGLYRGRIDHIAEVVAGAGFRGLEPEVFMLGDFFNARRLSGTLAEHHLELASVALAAEWRRNAETAEERAEADKLIGLLRGFPSAKLVLVQLPGPDRSDLQLRQRRAIECMNAVGRRALDAGVKPTVHPNSPPGSVFRVETDYETLLDGLDPDIGFTADVGHVAVGGMGPLPTVTLYRERLDHLHFKDVGADGRWAPTGEGRVDFEGITAFLAATGYHGWIVFEDESEQARQDPGAAARHNAEFVRQVLVPAVRGKATQRFCGPGGDPGSNRH
jgi:inosose dehydratase